MKVLHINTSDSTGGAAIAAHRLHIAMRNNGIDSHFLCLCKTYNEESYINSLSSIQKVKYKFIYFFNQFIFKKRLSRIKGLFSNNLLGLDLTKYFDFSSYDVIYIHWIGFNFLSIKGIEKILKLRKPVIWFMHDMFPITGGCHHSFECEAYKNTCKKCPYLKSKKLFDFSTRQQSKKIKSFSKYNNLSFVAPSEWLYNCTKQALIAKNHKVYHIPNILDTSIFRPYDKKYCREILNLPVNKKIILFGADSALTNPYKGFDYLIEALLVLSRDNEINNHDIELVLFGAFYNSDIETKLPFKSHFMGVLKDSYTISMMYNAADVFCIPSLAENFANTVLESVNCHTPVVGFDVGGIPDVVCKETGYLAEYKNSEDFANGIKKVLYNKSSYKFDICTKYSEKVVLDEYSKIWSNSND